MIARSVAMIAHAKTRAGALIGQIRQKLADASYRPEAHYMRGPGPKSRQAAR
jgi:hypothetical protein